MKLGANLQPIEKFPDCVKLYFWRGLAFNSVGLSSPGAVKLFKMGEWQKIKQSFGLSHMSVLGTFKQRLAETTYYRIFRRLYGLKKI